MLKTHAFYCHHLLMAKHMQFSLPGQRLPGLKCALNPTSIALDLPWDF